MSTCLPNRLLVFSGIADAVQLGLFKPSSKLAKKSLPPGAHRKPPVAGCNR
ncbi:MAG: hypothetical protein VBE63_05055 [Lamprobacter sp.]|uniref:hypothetical protein n=1 Tax=Lamprobacter sp. TaxID=3100796 RepID=UPI002B26213C|nr:hypothetical protein [Lamprobacter sp.]MEA3639297.1 hypothetical protein [Lamprobacter sp.]